MTDAPTGIWLGASHILGRPVPVDRPYPHVCLHPFHSKRTGKVVALPQVACGACADGGYLPGQ